MEFEAARIARFKRKSGLPVRVPVVDLIEIGAGGGSIARVDSLGLPAVGPKSAGSEPGSRLLRAGRTRADRDRRGHGARLPQSGLLSRGKAAARHESGGGSPRGARRPPPRDAGDRGGLDGVPPGERADGPGGGGPRLGARGGPSPVRAARVRRGRSDPCRPPRPLARDPARRRPPNPGVLSALGAVLAPPHFDLAASYRSELDRLDLPGRIASSSRSRPEAMRSSTRSGWTRSGAR